MVVSKTLPGQIQGLAASFLQVPSNCLRKVKPWARRQEITTRLGKGQAYQWHWSDRDREDINKQVK